jgi:hypothetical protein
MIRKDNSLFSGCKYVYGMEYIEFQIEMWKVLHHGCSNIGFLEFFLIRDERWENAGSFGLKSTRLFVAPTNNGLSEGWSISLSLRSGVSLDSYLLERNGRENSGWRS